MDCAEGLGDPLGDARLAVARRAEQEQAAAGVDRRAEPDQHVLVDQQVFERAVQVVFGRMLVGERLLLDAVDVGVERHRRGAEVGAVLGELLGPLAAQLGELVDVVVHRAAPLWRDQPVVLHRMQQRVDQPKRQLQVVGQIAAGGLGCGC